MTVLVTPPVERWRRRELKAYLYGGCLSNMIGLTSLLISFVCSNTLPSNLSNPPRAAYTNNNNKLFCGPVRSRAHARVNGGHNRRSRQYLRKLFREEIQKLQRLCVSSRTHSSCHDNLLYSVAFTAVGREDKIAHDFHQPRPASALGGIRPLGAHAECPAMPHGCSQPGALHWHAALRIVIVSYRALLAESVVHCPVAIAWRWRANARWLLAD